MSALATFPGERRRHARVYDAVSLMVHAIPDRERDSAERRFEQNRERTRLVQQLDTQARESLVRIARLESESPTTAALATLLQQQINGVRQLVLRHPANWSETPTHKISLSESGISFGSDQPLVPGALLELHLALFPGGNTLYMLAESVNCMRSGTSELNGLFSIGLRLHRVDDGDRQTLAEHINALRCQTATPGRRYSSVS